VRQVAKSVLLRYLAASGVAAAEYHGTVKSNGLPFPGVTVSLSQGGTKTVATTDAW